jgi:DNA-binding transcriptional MerR regulator
MNGEIPIQKVIDMRNQGFANEKIIESLLSEKYTYQQIRDAIQQAEIKKNVSSQEISPAPITREESAPKMQEQTIRQAPASYSMPMQRNSGINIDEIQRILEEIISEKWKESEEVIRNMIEWKAVISTKMKELETRISEFNLRVDAMNNSLGKKAEEFNQTMADVDTEVKALDKALNKLIPALSDNISELKEIVSKK